MAGSNNRHRHPDNQVSLSQEVNMASAQSLPRGRRSSARGDECCEGFVLEQAVRDVQTSGDVADRFIYGVTARMPRTQCGENCRLGMVIGAILRAE